METVESPKRQRQSPPSKDANSRQKVQHSLESWRKISQSPTTNETKQGDKVVIKKKKLVNVKSKQRGSRLLKSFRNVHSTTGRLSGLKNINLRQELKNTRVKMAESWSNQSTSSNDESSNQEKGEETSEECSNSSKTEVGKLKDPDRVFEEKGENQDSSKDESSLQGSKLEENNKCQPTSEDGIEGNKEEIKPTEDSNSSRNEDDDIVEEDTQNFQDIQDDEDSSNENHKIINREEEDVQMENNTNDGRVTLNGEDQNNNEEDEINTQTSDQTLTHQTSILPQWFRFRLIVKMASPPADIVAQQQRGEEVPEEYQDDDKRLLKVLKKFVVHLKSFDETAMILEWSAKNDDDGVEAILTSQGIPNAPSEIKTFFEGFKGKKSGPVYIKVRISTKFNPEDFQTNMKTWLKENECTLMKCPIQAENAEEIGWLAYTSQYSDKKYIGDQLEKMLGFEVGVRLASIAPKAEYNLDWKKKSRGLIVVVPSNKASSAKKRLNMLFQARKEHNYDNPNPVLDIFHQLTFLPLESEIAKMPNCKTNYAVCLHRHQVHDKSIQARFMPDILIDVDKKINTNKGRKSLRQLILNIKSKKEETKGTNLFQSIDKIEDSSKVYFPYDKKVGRGEAGHIFQFYQCLEEEANVMFQGLGVYLQQEHGIENLHSVIGVNHWAENELWHWDKKEGKFITPEEQLVQGYVEFDSNAKILGMQEQNLDKAHGSGNLTSTIIQQQQHELIRILNNPDLDPITTLDQPIQTVVDEVTVNDQASTTSSVTFGEEGNQSDASSQGTKRMDNKKNDNSSTTSSIGSIGTKTMRGLIDPTLTAAENRQRLAASTSLRVTRLKQRQKALDLELKQQQLREESQEQKSENFEQLVTQNNISTDMENLNLHRLVLPASGKEAGKAP